jgi:hypothetical protein
MTFDQQYLFLVNLIAVMVLGLVSYPFSVGIVQLVDAYLGFIDRFLVPSIGSLESKNKGSVEGTEKGLITPKKYKTKRN